MGDSQSRYSIVERLTNKKLQIMDDKLKLGSGIDDKEVEIMQTKELLRQAEEEAMKELEDKKQYFVDRIATLEKEKNQLEKFKSDKESSFEAKIQEINNALKRIEDISKSAGGTTNED